MAKKKAQAETAATSEQAAPVAEAAAPVEKAPKDTKNGVTRPAPGNTCDKVWSIADMLAAELGDPAKVSLADTAAGEGVAATVGIRSKLAEYGQEINAATVSTQYSRWRKYHGLTNSTPRAPKAPASSAAVEGSPSQQADEVTA